MNKAFTPPRLIRWIIALAVVACLASLASQRAAAQDNSFTVSGTVTNTDGQPMAGVMVILISDAAGTQIVFTDQRGNYVLKYAGETSHSLRILASKSGWLFNPFTITVFSTGTLNFDISESFVGSQIPIVLSINMPVLLTQENSLRALALDSVMRISEPFGVVNTNNFSADQRSRVSLFAVNVELNPGENPASAIQAQAETSTGQLFPLTLEHFGPVPNFTWLKQIVVKLPNEIANSNEVRVSLKVHDTPGNNVIVKVKP